MNGWSLPGSLKVGGADYPIHGDYRDILEIFSYLNDPDLPAYLRWQIALALFYQGHIPPEHTQEAMEQLVWFINCGTEEKNAPGPKLLDWEQDALSIVADVNKVAGGEIRSMGFVHWWTFLSWFHAVGEGQLSAIVSIRDKLRRGKKLESWEKEFYLENRHRIDLKKRLSAEELAQREKLQALLR